MSKSTAIIFLFLMSAPTLAEPNRILVDSTGKAIGPILSNGNVLLKLDGTDVTIGVKDGQFERDEPVWLFVESDCKGASYLNAGLLPPPAYFARFQDGIVYPTNVRKMASIKSKKLGTGACSAADGRPQMIGEVGAVLFKALDLAPPFTVKSQ